MIFRIKLQEERKKAQFDYFKLVLFFLLFSLNTFSQDSIPAAKDLTEDKELNFQQFFFKALSQKSIGNYQKAIENLESCNQILSNEISVYFEFSKNYLLLNNTLLAKEYIDRALEKDTSNLWMLKHLVKIYTKDKNFSEAIKVQQKVVTINPKERELLVGLFFYNKEHEKAISLMHLIEKDNGLSAELKRLKRQLEKRKEVVKPSDERSDITSLIKQFNSDKSYKILKKILQKSIDSTSVLLKYSDEGIALFPAQPYMYLMKARAFNNQKLYKKALTILQNGIDFVIEDRMESDFYKEMATSYNGLGNLIEEKKYLEKSKKIKS
ncbi:hypothetical protein BTO04_11615 [Polaribacter sp. SA4-10]|uniref:tetratricopeptide repeat protein n=1 Tax=Polaribacter sp. SA4-10 TaxID=754397 RepID=UPI000B3D035A|nr:hypothetical protein [Polaribacter sp. SA4-10]ARV07295.1 hypothetical protein BTO04_11615 [Polaribacter sp. SA4-10]